MTTFQSRFGPQEWLTPYTDKTLEEIQKQGNKNILVICPGFASDCVETLEEIAIQGKESFVDAGGEGDGDVAGDGGLGGVSASSAEVSVSISFQDSMTLWVDSVRIPLLISQDSLTISVRDL